jgi:RNA polymerase sigma-70 factor (ECF subfamily)
VNELGIEECGPNPGEPGAVDLRGVDALLPAVYEELHALAEAVLRRYRPVDSTRTSSLINDAYVRLARRGLRFRDHSHFLCVAARAMRMVLIDRARRRTAAKRGDGQPPLTLDDSIAAAHDGPDLLAVEEALTRLAGFDERKSRVVELRFYGGLSVEETAQALALSPATVKREWTLARAWLLRAIAAEGSDGP